MFRRVGAPGALAEQWGARMKEGPLRTPLPKERNGPAIGFKLPLSLTVGRSLLQAERSGSESRRGCQGSNLVGPPGVQP